MAMQDLRQRPISQNSPEHYRRHRQKLAQEDAVKKLHADLTKKNIWGMMTLEHYHIVKLVLVGCLSAKANGTVDDALRIGHALHFFIHQFLSLHSSSS